MKSLGIALILSVAFGAGIAFAEDQPATGAAAPPAKMSKMNDADKKAISKSCSDQANAKGLHGTQRKKFRSACKRAGGKAPM